MSRFRDILRGTLARKPITFPTLWGVEGVCAVVPLVGAIDADILQGATEFARKRGIEKPQDGDPLYELGIWVHTLVRGCVDVDSPDTAPVPYFSSVEEILDGLDRDRIALLFEAQQRWQDHCAPRQKSMSLAEYSQAVLEHAAASEDVDELPFERWPRILQRSFVHTLAAQHVTLLQLKSISGDVSVKDGGESTSSSTSTEVAGGETATPEMTIEPASEVTS